MWIKLLMLCATIGPFIFRVLGFLSAVVALGLVLYARSILPWKHSRLLWSCCIKWPFSYPVKGLPYIWKLVLLTHIYVMKVVQLFFISFSTSMMHLILANKHGITLIQVYIPTYLNVEVTVCHIVSWLQGATASSHSWGYISSLGPTGGWHVGIFTYKSMSTKLDIVKYPTTGSCGIECLQPCLVISGELCVSFSTFCSPGSIKVPDRTFHRSIEISCSSGTLFHEGSLASHSSPYVSRDSSLVSYSKNLVMDVSVGWVLKVLQSLHLTLWLLRDVCCTDKGSIPPFVRWWLGWLKHL